MKCKQSFNKDRNNTRKCVGQVIRNDNHTSF